jgi:hypothetical protein
MVTWLDNIIQWSIEQSLWLEPLALIIILLAGIKYILFGK